MGTDATLAALGLSQELRSHRVNVELDSRGGSLKSMLRRADNMGSRVCVVLGKDELARGIAQVKDLSQHTQDEVPLAEIARRVTDLFTSPRKHDTAASTETDPGR
jgi:histidyl-tRNA synthetase